MDAELVAAVRSMALDVFLIAHPHWFVTGLLPRGRATPRLFAHKLAKRHTGYGRIVTVGRGEGCDIEIPDGTVSRLHAFFRERDEGFELVDAASRNGTRLDGARLAGKIGARVRVGARLRFGSVELDVRGASETWQLLREVEPPASAIRRRIGAHREEREHHRREE